MGVNISQCPTQPTPVTGTVSVENSNGQPLNVQTQAKPIELIDVYNVLTDTLKELKKNKHSASPHE